MEKPKILALYLPAFHQIPINDKVWGVGFTEWENVKKGKPIYKGHEQPEIPLNGYYDLLNKSTIENQFKIASNYGIFGFVFYHYWFNGEKVFEKPAEVLLQNINIKGNFCFTWANETWSKTWSGKEKEIILKQDYGNQNDWLLHIKYLTNFFKDSRYIKVKGKPVFFIYNWSAIPKYKEMIEYWDEYLKKQGFEGIYIVDFISPKTKGDASGVSNAAIEFEPLYTSFYSHNLYVFLKRSFKRIIKKTEYLDYDFLWNRIINRKKTYKTPLFKSCFVAWDNSPRKGRRSLIIKNSNPDKFSNYLLMLIHKHRGNTLDDFVIINAWNEWGEGAMLEPTKRFQYGYLEAIKNVIDKLDMTHE